MVTKQKRGYFMMVALLSAVMLLGLSACVSVQLPERLSKDISEVLQQEGSSASIEASAEVQADENYVAEEVSYLESTEEIKAVEPTEAATPDDVEVSGVIESVGDGFVVINGITYNIGVDTHIDLNGALAAGQSVKVDAWQDANGVWHLKEIEAQDSEDVDDGTQEIDNGATDDIDNGATDDIDNGATDDIDDGATDEIDNGATDEIDNEINDVEVTGVVQEIGNGTVVIDGKTYTLGPDVELEGELTVGQTVKLEVWQAPDGSLTIKDVEVEEPEDAATEEIEDVEDNQGDDSAIETPETEQDDEDNPSSIAPENEDDDEHSADNNQNDSGSDNHQDKGGDNGGGED